MKRLIAGLLCLVMLLSLAACGKEKENEEITLEADIDTPLYTRELLPRPDAGSSFEMLAVGAGNSVVICGLNAKGEHCLFRMDTPHLSFETIPCDLPCSPETLDGLSDGSAVLSYHDEDGALVICEIGADNSVAFNTLTLPEELAEAYIFDLKAVEGGYLLTSFERAAPCFYIVDRQGALLNRFAYEGDDAVSVLRGNDDHLTVVSSGKESTLFQLLDDTLSVSTEYSMETPFYSFLNGGGSGEVIGILPLGKACVVQLETGEMQGFINLSDIRRSWRSIVLLPDGELFCVEDGQAAIWRVSDEQRVILKMQTMLSDDYFLEGILRDAVIGFNKSSGKYYIELVDYGEYGDRAEEMLLADLMGNRTLDIFDLNSFNAESFYKNNLLADLKPFFDADPDINYEDIIAGVRRITERDGGAYELIPQFAVHAMFAPASVVGDGHFTMDSFAALAEAYGTERLFGQSKTGERLLREAIDYCNDFIDLRERRCSFDSPEFITLLEIAKAMPTEMTSDLFNDVYHGDALLLSTGVGALGCLEGIDLIDALYRGDWRCVGFPSEGTGVTLSPRLRLGMASNSQNQEGVWEFFKYLLSNGYQWNIKYDLPAVSRVLEQRMDAEIQLGWTKIFGNVRINEKGDGLEVGPPTEEQKQQTLELLDKIDRMDELDPAVLNMVMNEAARFFAGDCTAEQAAANIQSKASIYLSEQYG